MLESYRKISTEEVQEILKKLMVEVDAFCREREINYYIIGGTLLGAVRHSGFIPWDDDIDIGMLRDDYNKFLAVAPEFSSAYEIKNYKNDKYADYVITRIYIPDTYIDNLAARKTKIDHRLYFDIFPLDKTPGNTEENVRHAKKIKKLKTNVIYSIPYQYSKSFIKSFAKKGISFVLSPFRKNMLKKLDKTMAKYSSYNSMQICSMGSQYSYEKQTMDFKIYGEPKDYIFEDVKLMGPADSDKYLMQLYGTDYMQLPPLEKRRKGYDVYVKSN